jgi:poly(3-hydroxybutyrate) depolymerase
MRYLRLVALAGSSALLALCGSACSSEDPVPSGMAGTNPGVSGSTGTGGAAGSAPTGTAGHTTTAGTGNATAGTAGVGGTPGTAGTGGTTGGSTGGGGAATGGTGGTGTAGTGTGGGAGGLPNAVASDGCGKAAGQPLEMFMHYDEMITPSALVTEKWQARGYWVRLPANYNPMRPYPTVFVGPGCGGKGNNAIPIQDAAGENAIVVGLDYSSAATGRDCFMTEAYPDPEVNYVEETAANVMKQFCVDKSRLFIEGFSSGSWISYLMGCVAGGPGGLFKGNGTATGNWQGSLPDSACKGPIAFMGSHDSGDPQGYNEYPGGRDHVLKQNGCTTPPVTTPYDPGPMVKAPAGKTINCVQYMGCQAPTVFCTTTGMGHSDQVPTGISTYGFWKFWMDLP